MHLGMSGPDILLQSLTDMWSGIELVLQGLYPEESRGDGDKVVARSLDSGLWTLAYMY
jgi:hypothetical protein